MEGTGRLPVPFPSGRPPTDAEAVAAGFNNLRDRSVQSLAPGLLRSPDAEAEFRGLPAPERKDEEEYGLATAMEEGCALARRIERPYFLLDVEPCCVAQRERCLSARKVLSGIARAELLRALMYSGGEPGLQPLMDGLTTRRAWLRSPSRNEMRPTPLGPHKSVTGEGTPRKVLRPLDSALFRFCPEGDLLERQVVLADGCRWEQLLRLASWEESQDWHSGK